MKQNTSPQIASPQKQNWYFVLYEYILHFFIGTLLFLIIASFAVGIDKIVSLLKTYQVSEYILLGILVGEYMLFLADLVLFGIFLSKSIVRFKSDY